MPNPPKLVIGLFILGALLLVISSVAFSSVQSNRATSVEAAEDPNALLGLDVAESVHKGPQSPLVNVTNSFQDRDMTVTVALQNGNDGTLYVNGQSGDSVTFTVPAGGTVTVDIDVSGNPDTVVFDVDAIAGGVSMTAPGRQTKVTGGSPGGGGGGPPK